MDGSRRVSAPPPRLSYYGLGKQTTNVVPTSSGSRNVTQVKRGPPNPYLNRPTTEIQERIDGLEKLVNACQDVIKEGKPISDKIEAEGFDKLAEEEAARWVEIKGPYFTAIKHLWQNQQDLKWYREALAVQENKQELSSKTSTSSHTSLVTLIKQVDVSQRKEAMECRHVAEQEIEKLDVEIEDLKGTLASPGISEETAAADARIKFLEEKKHGIQTRMESKLRRIEEAAKVKKDELEVQAEINNEEEENISPEKIYPHQDEGRKKWNAIHPLDYPEDNYLPHGADQSQFYEQTREIPPYGYQQEPYGNAYADLATALKDAFKELKGEKEWEPKDLPIFNGDAEDWPIFRNEFKRTTPAGKVNSSQNAIRLRRALKGTAKEAVQGLLHEPSNMQRIMEILESNFGRKELVLESLIAKAEQVKSPDIQKPEQFVAFGRTVQNLVGAAKAMKEECYLNDIGLLNKFVHKLPAMMSLEWLTWITSRPMKKKNLEAFGDWVDEKMRLMVQLVKPVLKPDITSGSKQAPKRGSVTVHATTSEEQEATPTDKRARCQCCGRNNHKLRNCFKFKRADIGERLKIVKTSGTCFRCLETGHIIKECKSDRLCGVDDCTANHHALLHMDRKWKESNDEKVEDSGAKAKESIFGDSSNIGAMQSNSSRPLSIVRVKVTGPKGTRRTYALLDSGADTTLIEERLAKAVGISGVKRLKTYRGIVGRVTQVSEIVQFKVCGNFNTARSYDVTDAVTIEKLGLSPYSQDAKEVKRKWPHMKRAKLENFICVVPQLIIGEDNPTLSAHRELLERKPDEPMAKRTALGWVMAGKKIAPGHTDLNVNVCTAGEEENLDSLIRHYFSLDSYGVYPQTTTGSIEDRRALDILEKTVKRVNKQWECGLLWRDENVKLPESRPEALSRLLSNERRMKRDPLFSEMYHAKFAEYEQKGYIRELPDEEAKISTDKTMYIPHFAVFNVNKPGKLRLVFDAACKNQGVSLNEYLLTGPDLIRPLTAVLLNFRLHNIVITGDMEDMFHRVAVRKDDRSSQRFLWRNLKDKKGEIKTYEMNVLIFGACSSPSSAIFVKNRNAEEFNGVFPEAARIIKDDFYCDDCLTGAKTVKDAIQLRHEITKINSEGNFNVKKWLSNSKDVMDSIPEEDRAAGVKGFGDKTELPTERVLGMWWNPEEDVFTFNTNFKKVDPSLLEGRRPTKREATSLLMSIFDPLGILANFKIKGLILLQWTWRCGIGWDDEVTDDIYEKWKEWVENLKLTVNVKLPRLYCRDIHLATSVELHIFTDSSEEACAVTCYLRVKIGETIIVAFVAAKANVAPNKKLTIPRLELLSAATGANLADTVQSELRVKINGRTFWTDSKTVLMWIRSETLRFKEYVANRVNKIHLLTNVSEWRWIPTKLNVADQGTRLKSPIQFDEDSTWLRGPEFLHNDPNTWPTEKSEKVPEVEEEMRKSRVYALGLENEDTFSTVPIAKFSSHLRMVRSQAGVHKAAIHWMNKMKKAKIEEPPWKLKNAATLPLKKVNENADQYKRKLGNFLKGNLSSVYSPDELEKAEIVLIKMCQREVFPDELISLKRGKLEKSSKLWKLSAFLKDGVLRLQGRIGAAMAPESMKNPIILPSRHAFTETLIMTEHIKNAHQGHGTVLCSLRNKYWIIDGRAAVRRAVSKCWSCKLHKTKPISPVMGDLPPYRVAAGHPPFYYTGIDLFGPVEVVVGRHHEKRWVAVFTCMVTRAIHLEVVYGLSTDETLMALSRFIDQRGRCHFIYTDNGTNFVGAKKVLRESWNEVEWEKIMNMEKFREIQWSFTPPCSPHFGGAWERMVQAVKKVLRRTLFEKYPKDQTLLTMLKGAENMVNSRPLSYTSSDPEDPDPLTPNHFLRGFADVGPSIPGEYEKEDEVSRAQWRRAQAFLEELWNKWTKEVLPDLVRKTKWYHEAEPVQVGEIVLMVDDQMPRNTWVKAVVTATFPADDGQVRVVLVTTTDFASKKKTTYKRGVDKICPLGLYVEKSVQVP